MREDFEPIKQLMQRPVVLAKQLTNLNGIDWVHLKTQEDFDTLYRLPSEICLRLTKIYVVGRQFASEVSYMLKEFEDAALYPSFKSWVDEVGAAISQALPKLKDTIQSVREQHDKLNESFYSIEEMLRLTEQQVAIAEALLMWVEVARKSSLYQTDAGIQDVDSDELNSAVQRATYRGFIMALEAGALVATVALAVLSILDQETNWGPWIVLAGAVSVALEWSRRNLGRTRSTRNYVAGDIEQTPDT